MDLVTGEFLTPDARYYVDRGVVVAEMEQRYVESFGFEWNRHPTTQLERTRVTNTDATFWRKTGLRKEDVVGRSILDAGCGMGRFADTCLRHGAEFVVAADLSASVFPAYENLREFSNVVVLKADLLNLPLQAERFDIIFSIGVLHHTENPPAVFKALSRLLKPGGTMAVWVYEDNPAYHNPTYLWFTKKLRALPLPVLYEVCKVWAPQIRDELYHSPTCSLPPEVQEALKLCINVSDNNDLCILDTFDWVSCTYQWKYRYTDVEQWFSDGGFTDINRLPVPVSVNGVKRT